MARRSANVTANLLALVVALLCAQAAAAPSADAVPTAETFVSPAEASWTWSGIARCALEPKSQLDCIEQRSKRAVELLVQEERSKSKSEGRTKGSDEDDDVMGEDIERLVDQLSESIVDAAGDALERKLRGVVSMRSSSSSSSRSSSGNESNAVGEGRGKKKKKLKKLLHLLKLIILIVLVKLKVAFILLKLQTLFQFKLVIMVFLILLCKKLSLWNDFKHKLDPQKVIYYEHAQHQHHYDDSHWHDEHEAPSSGGGWNLWGRSYDTAEGADDQHRKTPGGTVSFPGLPGIQNGIYRAADGTRLVIGQPAPDAQHIAYSAHRKR